MLNPSTADEIKDDPTIRKCVKYAKRNGFNGLHVVNLFAFRSTDPKILKKRAQPYLVGPENDAVIRYFSRHVHKIVVAWGAHGDSFPERTKKVLCLLRETKDKLWCLGTTSTGQPRHPLYVKDDRAFSIFQE